MDRATFLDPGGAEAEGDRHPRIERFFVALDKYVRGIKLYRGQGRVVDRMGEDAYEKARAALEDGPFTVRVASFGLLYADRLLEIDERRVPYLFRLFCDGVRELTLLDGLDREELDELARILATDLQGLQGKDLATLLWERELPHLRWYIADTFSAGFQVTEDGELLLGEQSARLRSSELGRELALSPDDLRVLSADESLKWVEEVDAPTRASGPAAALAERIRQSFLTPRDVRRFLTLALRGAARDSGEPSAPQAPPLVLDFWDAHLREGSAEPLVELLEGLVELEERLERSAPQSRALQAVHALQSALGRPERMAPLAPLVQEETARFLEPLERMVERAQPGLVALLSALPAGEAQSRLHRMLQQAGVDLTDFYKERLDSSDPETVLHAVRALGELGTPEATLALAGALSRKDTAVRRAALEALRGHYDPRIRMPLARALRDPDRDNRLLALEVLASSGDRRLAWALLSAVQDSRFQQKDPEEQLAFYTALASIQDPRTFEHFRGVLSRRNLMRNRAVARQQAMAIQALARAGNEGARELLSSFRDARNLSRELRRAIAEALRA